MISVLIYLLCVLLVLFICLYFIKHTEYEYFTAYSNSIPITFIVMTNVAERTQNIDTLIQAHSLQNYNIFDAVVGKELNNNELYKNNIITEHTKNNIKPGAIGCTLSHINVWKQFLDKNDSKLLLVMEDDLDVSNDFIEQLNNFVKYLPDDIEIAQIYHSSTTEKNKINVSTVNNYVETGYPQNGTVAYIISKKGINILLKHCLPIYEAIDVMIKDAIRENKIISYVPTQNFVFHKFKFKSSVCGKGKSCASTI